MCQTQPLNVMTSTNIQCTKAFHLLSLIGIIRLMIPRAMTACCPSLPALGLLYASTAVESPTLATFCLTMIVSQCPYHKLEENLGGL